jgi:hypothetical protein
VVVFHLEANEVLEVLGQAVHEGRAGSDSDGVQLAFLLAFLLRRTQSYQLTPMYERSCNCEQLQLYRLRRV